MGGGGCGLFPPLCMEQYCGERMLEVELTEHLFDLPRLDYFEAGNGYSGNWEGFNYRIFNEKENLRAIVWYGPNCSDKSEVAAEQSFSIDQEGLERIHQWLEEQQKSGRL